MRESLPESPAPELVFGLVAPIGTDLDLLADSLGQALAEVRYEPRTFRLTDLMREVPLKQPLDATAFVESYRQRILYANSLRAKFGDDVLAALAISAIRSFRGAERRAQAAAGAHLEQEAEAEAEADSDADEREQETPIPRQAYILRQLKRPEEIALLRSVYGKQFVLVCGYAPPSVREKRIEDRERASRGGLVSDEDLNSSVFSIMQQDARESSDEHGQKLSDAYPLGDVFIDTTSRLRCEEMSRRFIRLLFGSNSITPTHAEYGMYIAKSASLRSSDLSRQVGAALFRPTGEVATLGCNEVPKAGGGTYWAEDGLDRRDFVEGHDPNERRKNAVLVDVIDRLMRSGSLSAELLAVGDANDVTGRLLSGDDASSLRKSKVMDLIEFGRIIHAEMSAITDAARLGIDIREGTLYCTVFPCHLCAKHIVAAGIKRLVYLEPYPKSYATDLHSDSIAVDQDTGGKLVEFTSFVGVSPFRYRDLFEKGRRKYKSGAAQQWARDEARPMIEVYFPSYFQAETEIVKTLKAALAD